MQNLNSSNVILNDRNLHFCEEPRILNQISCNRNQTQLQIRNLYPYKNLGVKVNKKKIESKKKGLKSENNLNKSLEPNKLQMYINQKYDFYIDQLKF